MRITERQLRSIVKEEISRTEFIKEAAAAPAGSVTHQVKPGDTISTVIKNYYGIPATGASYPLYNQVATASGIADSNKIKPGDVLQLPSTLGGKPRKGAAPAAAGAAPKSKQCDLPSYKDSLTVALTKAGITGLAMTATISLIISGKFFSATAAGLKAAADNLAASGASAGGAFMGTVAAAATGGGSEFVKSVVIGLCAGLSAIISGCLFAITKFSRDCDFKAFGAKVGSVFSLGLARMFQGVTGGIAAVAKFLTTGAAALASLLASAGLVALGITAAVVQGLVGLIQMGAQVVSAAISNAIIAAGTALMGAGAAVSAAGAGAQAAGAQTVAVGQAMPESRNRRGHGSNNVMQKLANDMLHAAKINRYLTSLDESTRTAVLASVI